MYDEGEIHLQGERIDPKHSNLNKVRENVGMVFQHFNLFPHMTSLENIIEAPIHVKIRSSKCKGNWKSTFAKSRSTR